MTSIDAQEAREGQNEKDSSRDHPSFNEVIAHKAKVVHETATDCKTRIINYVEVCLNAFADAVGHDEVIYAIYQRNRSKHLQILTY